MRIGIITFHNAINYGAILQCYATQELLKSMGHDVVVIDYHNKMIDDHYAKRRLHLITLVKRIAKGRLGYLLEVFFFRKRRKAFHKFIKDKIHLTNLSYYQGQMFLFDSYDVILIGSDQVWNKSITGGFDSVYWGNFIAPNTRKVAWSVCMNNIQLTDDEKFFIKEHLKNFDAVSVREDSLKELLLEFTSKQIYHTLDPTMIFPADKWVSLCNNVKEKGFIAVYAVRKEKEVIDFARKISKIQGKPLVIIRSYSKPYYSKENKEYASPVDFLSYIKNADFVITTSFHGTAFSLIFNKQFVCPALEINTRIASLLKSVNLEDRRVFSPEDIEYLKPIDYNEVKKKMDTLIADSLEFLNYVTS